MSEFYLEKAAGGMTGIPPQTAIRQIGSVLVTRARILSKFTAGTILRELPHRLESEVGITGRHKMVAPQPNSGRSS